MASAKFARKAGYSQTAYSSNLQAARWEAPYAYIESCKLLRSGGEGLRALQELDNMLKVPPRQIGDVKTMDNVPALEHKDSQKLQAKACSTSNVWKIIIGINVINRLCSFEHDGCMRPSGTRTLKYSTVSRSRLRHLKSVSSQQSFLYQLIAWLSWESPWYHLGRFHDEIVKQGNPRPNDPAPWCDNLPCWCVKVRQTNHSSLLAF